MRHNSTLYIVGFAGAVCVVCSLLVSSAAVLLMNRQKANALLDKQKKVLAVSGLIEEGARPGREDIQGFFENRIQPKIVNLNTGEYVPESEIHPQTYDQQEAKNDPNLSHTVERNRAQITRVPTYATIYEVYDANGDLTLVVLPVEGKGLWSTLYGFLALDKDGVTIRGLTFYQHGETPGLGGEVDNPKWRARWPGRKAYNEEGEPEIRVIKGPAGSPDDAPHQVDGLSGATLTSNGVTNLLRFWLGENGFLPYIEKQFRENRSTT